MSEEDDTIYIQMTEDEHDRLIKFVIEARQSIEWISEELGAVMHEGKSASGALLGIKSVVDEFEAGANVFEQRNMAGDVLFRAVRP